MSATGFSTWQIITPARLLLGLLVCGLPAWGQTSAPGVPVLTQVHLGWGAVLNGNQLIQRRVQGVVRRRASVPRSEWNGRSLKPLPLARDALRRVKNGLGVDWPVGGSGGLHFNLYSRHRIKGQGVRLRLGADPSAPGLQRWALGGSMQQVRTDDGDRFISFVPQLIVNPDGAHSRIRRWRFALEHGYFFGGDKRAAVAERVWQASIAVRF